MLPNIKLSKTQLSKTIQSDRFLGWHLGLLLKNGLPIIENVPQTLANSVLIPLKLTTAASAADVETHKRYLEVDISNNWNKTLYSSSTLSTQDNEKLPQLEEMSIKSTNASPKPIFRLFNLFKLSKSR